MIGDRVFREITDNVWDPLQRIEECDRDGVSMQVLSTVPVMFSYWAKPADALDLSRRLNDHIAEVVREHPKRFAGLATIPMQDPDLAAGELERCIRELGLRGAEIGTHVDANPHSGRIDPLNLDNASLQPVWSAAEKLNAAIFIHPWDMLGKKRMPKYWLPWLVGMPAFAVDLLDDLWRRVRPLSQASRSVRSRRRRVSVYRWPHRARVSRAAGLGRCGKQHKSPRVSCSRHHARPVLRRFTRARRRRFGTVAQAFWYPTRRARIRLSLSVR